jgi:predicted RNase H-like HicB family nuclease
VTNVRYYIGIVHKDENSDFGISFPDFPGCISAGATLEETLAMGREALAGHIAVMADNGEAIPEPSTMDAVQAGAECGNGGTPVLVPALVINSRTVRVNITLPEDALRQIDAFAAEHGLTRSGFLVSAAKKAMADTPHVAAIEPAP